MKADTEAGNLQAKVRKQGAEKDRRRNVVVLRQALRTVSLFGSVSIPDLIASFRAWRHLDAARSC